MAQLRKHRFQLIMELSVLKQKPFLNVLCVLMTGYFFNFKPTAE